MEQKATGFASPAQGYEDTTIDLNGLLVRNPPATFFFRLESEDMAGLGLAKGALLVVDRSRNPAPDDFVLFVHEGRFLCRLMVLKNGVRIFTDGNSDIKPTTDDTAIIGVVTASIKAYGYDISR
jgi:SOS-response transcriptional repressors (RecA-mediated autopeptidases)